MNDQQKYQIKLHPKALKEYQNLQGSDLQKVNAAFEEMETRAEEVNKDLVKKPYANLFGTKEVKFGNGIRIIYYVTDRTINVTEIIVEVLIIDYKTNYQELYIEAEKRLRECKISPGINDEDSAFYFRYYIEKDFAISQSSMGNQTSWIDEIFEDFDNLPESLMKEILYHYNRGDIKTAYQVFKKGTTTD